MAEQITIQDVRDFTGTALPDSLIQAYIDIIDEADDCLDSNNVPAARQTLLKLNGVGYLISINSSSNDVQSLSGPLGDSITFRQDSTTLSRNPYGQQLLTLDRTGCIIGLFSNDDGVMVLVLGGDEC